MRASRRRKCLHRTSQHARNGKGRLGESILRTCRCRSNKSHLFLILQYRAHPASLSVVLITARCPYTIQKTGARPCSVLQPRPVSRGSYHYHRIRRCCKAKWPGVVVQCCVFVIVDTKAEPHAYQECDFNVEWLLRTGLLV